MTQQRLTTFEYALLGLIGMSPMTGYDVHKVFATTPFAHFSSSPGSIYPALHRLARRGLLEAILDKKKEARPRRVYKLTSRGEEALKTWIHQPVTREELIRGSGAPILRFAFAKDHLSKEQILAYLETYQKVVAAYLCELSSYADQVATAGMLHYRLALDHGIRSFQSELEWCVSAATEIKKARHSYRKRRKPR